MFCTTEVTAGTYKGPGLNESPVSQEGWKKCFLIFKKKKIALIIYSIHHPERFTRFFYFLEITQIWSHAALRMLQTLCPACGKLPWVCWTTRDLPRARCNLCAARGPKVADRTNPQGCLKACSFLWNWDGRCHWDIAGTFRLSLLPREPEVCNKFCKVVLS